MIDPTIAKTPQALHGPPRFRPGFVDFPNKTSLSYRDCQRQQRDDQSESKRRQPPAASAKPPHDSRQSHNPPHTTTARGKQLCRNGLGCRRPPRCIVHSCLPSQHSLVPSALSALEGRRATTIARGPMCAGNRIALSTVLSWPGETRRATPTTAPTGLRRRSRNPVGVHGRNRAVPVQPG